MLRALTVGVMLAIVGGNLLLTDFHKLIADCINRTTLEILRALFDSNPDAEALLHEFTLKTSTPPRFHAIYWSRT